MKNTTIQEFWGVGFIGRGHR